MNRLLKPALFLIALSGFFSMLTASSSALSGSEFKPGRIIDDVVFTNKSSMTASQIQTFLESKVANGSCDTVGSRPSSRWNTSANRNYTHAEWGSLNGNPAPFVCLTTYRENSSTKQTNLGNPGALVPGDGSQSAAEIILSAAQQYKINPQTLLVLLQKEQTLVTDDWPWSNQYQSATGAYCPDTAGCDATKAGFGTQVREAARLFRSYMDSPFLYFIGSNNVRYNPNAACGSSTVNIENLATVALYHYTPYQPNTAALDNLYGTGDGCSAYGNRNFWRLFNDWFGSPFTATFDSEFVGMTPAGTVPQGGSAVVSFNFKNVGNFPWKTNNSVINGYHAVNLASTYPINRVSRFTGNGWVWPPAGRIASFNKVYEENSSTLAPDQTTVWPRQVGKFDFSIYVPAETAPGTYTEVIQPVAEGAPNWIMGGWSNYVINVVKAFHDSTFQSMTAPGPLHPGQTGHVVFNFKNTGTLSWKNNSSATPGFRSINLASTYPINRVSRFTGNGWVWPPAGRIASFNKVYDTDGITLVTDQYTVRPGEVGRFEFDITVPANTPAGTYTEVIQPVAEGAPNWIMGGWSNYNVVVN